jgi:hypothetical protein
MLHTMLQQHCCRGTLTTAQELGQLCWNGPAGVATYGLVIRSRVAWNRRCMLMSRPPRGVVFQCSRAQSVDQVVARRGGVQASERCSVPMQQSPECRPGGGTKGGGGGAVTVG